MVFLSGRLGEQSREYLAANDQIAVLGVVSKEDRGSFVDMTAIYGQSKNEASDVFILDDLGIGAAMGSVWRDRFPNEKPIDFTIGEWLIDRLDALGKRTEVSFQSQDGYTLYADLILPEKASADHKVPGVVLLHSALGDRHIFESLGQSLSRRGIAVLAVDWRGRGQSIERGYHFDLSKAEREKTPLDVIAAIKFLRGSIGVDGNRLGIVGLVLSAKYAMLAAASEARLKTLVVMTGFIPGDSEKESINKLRLPILYLLSAGRPRVTKAMMDHFALTQSSGSQVFSYEGGTHGFHLLEMDKSWDPIIVGWLATHLEDR
jgi:dienelactone hydrolase